jgi:hypothetical protein
VLKKKIRANFQRIIEPFIHKIVTKLSKIWVWDPGSRIRDPGSGILEKPIADPWAKRAPYPWFRIRIRNTGWESVQHSICTHGAATADFWRTSHHDEKISPGWWGEGGGVYAHPLHFITTTYKVAGQINSLYFISTLYVLCVVYNHALLVGG